ncbi:NAD(P)-binding domain-containing protein [Bradyrhizobium sp. USDA 3397]
MTPLSTATPATAGRRIGLIGAGRRGTSIGISLLRYGAELPAPVTRSPEQAEQGHLNAIVGSDENTFPAAARVLTAFCENIVHVGDIGQGHKLKLVYNSMTMGIAAVAAGACQFAEAIDVDLQPCALWSVAAQPTARYFRISGLLVRRKAGSFGNIDHKCQEGYRVRRAIGKRDLVRRTPTIDHST